MVLSRETETPPVIDAYNRGLIIVKRPGVYLINGFVQLASVTQEDYWQKVSLYVNKGTGSGNVANNIYGACKIGPVKDGGAPFTFTFNITEEMINEEDVTKKKLKGEAYLQLNMARSGPVNDCPCINDNAGYHYCSITHLG